MSFVQRQAAHCDHLDCGHEWIPSVAMPTHCAKCKSRQWNKGAAQPDRALAKEPEAVGSIPTAPIKPNMQALRDICAGNILGVKYEPVLSDSTEVAICGKRWWEEGTQYECLMDKGHRDQKHGLRGMVQRLED